MHKQGCDFVLIVEHEAISPCDHGACQGSMREQIARDEQSRAGREEPEVHEVEDGDKVTEIEEEVVPGALLVLIVSEWHEV